MTGNPPNRNRFGVSFYVANTMEIFERLAWYGFFAVSSVYMTSPIAQGGLGFTDQQRGLLQGLIPFLLYLLPAFTGALGDRYGYKRMFLIAFMILSPAYFLLGQAKSFSVFTLVFIAVAIGAAIFKPLVVATVSRSTDDSNRGFGFGVFYVMVNVGGFVGPIVAGAMRAISWDWVFVMASVWIAINFIPVLFFYRDPVDVSASTRHTRSLHLVLQDLASVLGNTRFILLMLPLLLAVMLTNVWLAWQYVVAFAVLWCGLNWLWSYVVSTAQMTAHRSVWYRQRILISNRPFLLYLLIMAFYWAIYNQLFITLPLYVRDFVDTSDVVHGLRHLSPALAEQMASVNVTQLLEALKQINAQPIANGEPLPLRDIQLQLVHHKVMVPLNEIAPLLVQTQAEATLIQLASKWAHHYRQINPEYLLAFNFGCILVFQLIVSQLVQYRRAVLVLVSGTLVAAGSFVLAAGADQAALGGSIIVGAIVLFSIGEMLTSPKSQDYIAGIMPKAQAAMYMGYYFVSMALGFLLGGILSGWAYQQWAREANKPQWMWLLFSAIGIVTALALLWFNRYAAQHLEQQEHE